MHNFKNQGPLLHLCDLSAPQLAQPGFSLSPSSPFLLSSTKSFFSRIIIIVIVVGFREKEKKRREREKEKKKRKRKSEKEKK